MSTLQLDRQLECPDSAFFEQQPLPVDVAEEMPQEFVPDRMRVRINHVTLFIFGVGFTNFDGVPLAQNEIPEECRTEKLKKQLADYYAVHNGLSQWFESQNSNHQPASAGA